MKKKNQPKTNSKVFSEKVNDHTIFVYGLVAVVQVKTIDIEYLGQFINLKFQLLATLQLVVFDWRLTLEEVNNPIISEESGRAENNNKNELIKRLLDNVRLLWEMKDQMQKM
ncbi:hypothetical protein DEO72_LG3g1909 [Vigna unguiculata]|uniref:Uncharacterized protein n=1 Tax=Vigna unguiculata TaxID=3917 RepID=A0A4D6LGC7_VIGUN|nr:hypothetical protein DEO72_LG3g1909 [Vigna unguiculata]